MMVQGSKSRVRRDEMRLVVAHIHRLLAADLQPGLLQEDAVRRGKLVDWIVDTLKYLQAAAAGGPGCLACDEACWLFAWGGDLMLPCPMC